MDKMSDAEREKMGEETRIRHGVSKHLQGDIPVNRKKILSEKKHEMAKKMICADRDCTKQEHKHSWMRK